MYVRGGESPNRAFLGVDLSQIPSTYRRTGFPLWSQQVNASNINGDGLAKLASILVCIPGALTSSYTAAASGGDILSLHPSSFQIKWMFNLSYNSTMAIFSESLMDALQTIEPHNMSHTTFVNGFAWKLFMGPVYPTPYRSTDHPVDPRGLTSISENMDKFILSAAKAYLDGYSGLDTPASTITVPALSIVQVQAIHGSTPFLYTTSALIMVVACLLLLAIGHADPSVQPFTLESLLQQDELSEAQSERNVAST